LFFIHIFAPAEWTEAAENGSFSIEY
jgi:uncharacterized protein (DUF952 family)